MRKAAVVLAVVAAVGILAAAAVPRFVSMESYRPLVAAAISAKTGRTASFSKISLALFPWIAIRLDGFSLSGPPAAPSEALLSSPVAEFRVDLFPFLAGRNEFTTLVLRHPAVTVREFPDGSHSAADVLERLSVPDTPPPQGVGPRTSVALKGIRIEDGTLSVVRGGTAVPSSRFDLRSVSFRVSGIGARESRFSLEFPLPPPAKGAVSFDGSAVRRNGSAGGLSIRGEGKALGQGFRAQGVLSAPRGVVETDLSLSFPKVRAADLPAAFPGFSEFLSRREPQGYAKISAKISGDPKSLGFEIEADLTQTGWAVAGGLSKFIDAPCTLVIEGHRFPDAVVVSNAELRYPPLLLIGNASFSPATGAREYSASGRITSLAEFAKSRGGEFVKWSPAGRVVLSVAGSRRDRDSADAYRIEADLAEAGLVLPGRGTALSGFTGSVTVSPAEIGFSPLAGLINGQRFLLRGKVARGDAPAGEVELRMGYIDLAFLLPGAGGEGKKKTADTDPVVDRLVQAWNRELAFAGTVSIDAGNLWGVEFSNLSGTIRQEQGALSFEGVRAKMYGGEVVLSGGLTGPGIDPGLKARITMKDVEGGAILREKSRLGDFLSGKVTLSADVAGSRRDLAAFLRTVTGDGSLRIADGKIKGVNYPALAADAAAGTRGSPSGDTPFREIASRVAFHGGKAHLTDLRIDSGATTIAGEAVIGLADHSLEMVGTLWLSGALSRKPPWAGGGYYVARTGETAVPLVVSGTLRSPAVAVDTSAIGRAPGKMLRGGLSTGRKR
ncbi:MAG: hypothetical protein OHK0028_07370 [Deltaproteobacteria bacterium]